MNNIKKSEDFLDRMKGFLDNAKKQGNVMVRVEDIENAFSELVESEEERIHKLVTKIVDWYDVRHEYFTEIPKEKVMAWLKRQKTSEEAMKYLKETHSPSEMSDFQAAMNIAVAKAYDKGMKDGLEKQSEKHVNKTEPKFNIRNWITNGDYTWEVTDITTLDYILKSQDGNIVDDTISHVDEQFRIWTIQDAKDGDVLSNGDIILIFKQFEMPAYKQYIIAYIGLDSCGHIQVTDEHWELGIDKAKPATKEQHDLLFQKMKDTGYEWDAEKKEMKMIEQDPTDNTESKFHVEDWILLDKPCQIVSISKHGYYIVKYCDDKETSILSKKFCETHFHLWTIQDAKDGDVLYCKSDYDTEFIVMSKGINNYNNIDSYFRYNSDDGFGIDIPSVFSAKQDNITPATKEQRDFLFQKMREAGYEWYADKKEVKKIENEIEIPFGAKDSELQEVTYYIPEGFHAEIDNNKVIIKRGEKSTIWNEEDEKILKNIIDYFEIIDVPLQYPEKQVIDWLKSFKQRLFISGQS